MLEVLIKSRMFLGGFAELFGPRLSAFTGNNTPRLEMVSHLEFLKLLLVCVNFDQRFGKSLKCAEINENVEKTVRIAT